MAELNGVIVVAVEQAVAAAYCSGRLADAGARVSRVERPEGDFARGYDRRGNGQGTYFVWLNRGKESTALELKATESPVENTGRVRSADLFRPWGVIGLADATGTGCLRLLPGATNPPRTLSRRHSQTISEDRDLPKRLVARADVFPRNLAPGATGRRGLDSATLRARHPRLITCDISSYGESAPSSDLKAHDLPVQTESGLCSVTGDTSGPAQVGVSVCDIASGMNAHAAILQALYARKRTGRGRAIKVSLFSGMAEWMKLPFLQRRYGGRIPPRPGLAHPSLGPYGVFLVRDGIAVISIQNEREWARFCTEVMGDAALATDPLFDEGLARVRNRADLDGRVAARSAQLTLDEVASRLKAAEVAFRRLNDIAGLIAHPQRRQGPLRYAAGHRRIDRARRRDRGRAQRVPPRAAGGCAWRCHPCRVPGRKGSDPIR